MVMPYEKPPKEKPSLFHSPNTPKTISTIAATAMAVMTDCLMLKCFSHLLLWQVLLQMPNSQPLFCDFSVLDFGWLALLGQFLSLQAFADMNLPFLSLHLRFGFVCVAIDYPFGIYGQLYTIFNK